MLSCMGFSTVLFHGLICLNGVVRVGVMFPEIRVWEWSSLKSKRGS